MAKTELSKLKAERIKRNLSQKMLSDFTVLSLSTIVRAEQGKQVGADARQKLCKYFGKSPEDLGLVDEKLVSENPDINANEHIGMNRRDVIKVIGIGGASLALLGNDLLATKPWEQFTRAISSRHSINEQVIDQFQSITSSYWNMRANFTSKELLPGVIGHIQSITQTLGGSLLPSSRIKLCVVGGEANLVAGQICSDLNEPQAALNFYNSSLLGGKEAGDAELQAVALSRMSLVHIDNGNPQQAVLNLDFAERLVQGESGRERIHAWIKAIKSEAYAMANNPNASRQSFMSAEDLAATLSDEGDKYWTGFNTSRLLGYKGTSNLLLGNTKIAINAFSTALSEEYHLSEKRKPRIMLDLALALIQVKELEAACEMALQVICMSENNHVASLGSRFKRLKGALMPYNRDQRVLTLSQELTLAGFV